MQRLERADRHLPAYGLRYRLPQLPQQFVKTRGHQFHADPDVRVCDEAAEAEDDVLAVVALQHNVEVHQDALVLIAGRKCTNEYNIEIVYGILTIVDIKGSICFELYVETISI